MFTLDLSPFPELTTERMVLRRLRANDEERVFTMRSDPLVMQHVNRPMARTRADAAALIEKVNAGIAADESVHWAMTEKGDDAFIGLIGLWRIEKEHRLGELGYMVMRSHWGRGLASEAIAAIVPMAFSRLGLRCIEALTRPNNVASIRALEKNGFEHAGLLPDAALVDGVKHDMVCLRRRSTDEHVHG